MNKDQFERAVDLAYDRGYDAGKWDTAESIYEDLKAMVLMTDIPHGSEPAEENVEAVMWWQVSKYFKDKFNVGDYEEDDYDDEED